MSACWVFVILVGCRLSHATQHHPCLCNDQLRRVCAPVGGNVTVTCPKFDNGDDFNFNLFHENERISNHTGVELHRKNNSSSFILTGVNSSSFGIYRCEGTVQFPPPLIKRCDRTLVLIQGQHCNKDCIINKRVEPNCGYHWIWILALVSTYSIAVTILAVAFWIKLRRTDSQSDYMNTKPKPPRDRKKKRGVQNPIPRHF